MKLRDIYTESFIPTSVYKENKDYIDSLYEKFKQSKSKSEKQILKNELKEFTVSWDCHNTMKASCFHSLVFSKYEKIRVLDFYYNDEIGIYINKE